MNGRKSAVMAAVLSVMVMFFASAALAQSTCAVPADLKVVLVETQWKFDVKSGKLSGEGIVSNISKSDAIAPGIAVGVFNTKGEGIGTVLQRSTDARLAPGKTTRVKFSIDLKEIPASVMFTPFEGMQST